MGKLAVSFLGRKKLEEKLQNRITSFVDQIKSARSEREDQWDSYYKIWKAKEDDGKETRYHGRAKTFAPYGHRAVEVFASRVPSIIFGEENVVKVVDSKDKTEYGSFIAQLNTSKLLKQFNVTKQKLKWQRFFRGEAIYGTQIAAVNWRYDTREILYNNRVVEYDEDGYPTGYVTQEDVKEVDMFDAPDLRNIDIKKFFIDPTVKSIEDAQYVVEETRMSYNQVLRLARKGVFDMSRVKKLRHKGSLEQQHPAVGNTDSASSGDADTSIIDDERYDTTGFSSVDFSEQPLRVYEYWGLFEIKPGLEVEIVGTLIDDVLVRFRRNPYYHQKKPYISGNYIDDDQSFYGISMLEPVRLDILTANTIKNQMLDRNTQNLNCMWMVSRAAGIKKEDFKFRPNGVIFTNNTKGVEPLRPEQASLYDALRALEYLDKSVQETTGATNMLAGTETDLLKGTTAFAIKSNKTASTVKFATILDNNLIGAVKPYFYMAQDLNAQFCDTEDNVRILGPNGQFLEYTIGPDAILSDYEIEIFAGDELVNDAFQVQNIVSYLNWVLQLIPVALQYSPEQVKYVPDIIKMSEQVWNKLGFKEPMPKVPLMPMQQQMAAMGGAAQPQMGGANSGGVPPTTPGSGSPNLQQAG